MIPNNAPSITVIANKYLPVSEESKTPIAIIISSKVII